jgi:tRNA(Ile)-lysidine synthase
LFPGGERVLLAVSGGADSLALLGIIARLAPPLGVKLQATYVDHRLRPGAEIAADIETVGEIAAVLGVAFAPCRVSGRLTEGGHSPEESARRARYRALAREALRTDATTVATGHTRSDQAETVLLRLLRGSGLRGLGAMAPRAAWPHDGSAAVRPALIRPLLELTRDETAAYCRARGFEPRHDSENDNPRYLRNRLRHELLPQLRELNPAIEDALARLADEVRGHELVAADEGETPAVRVAWDGRPLVLDTRALRGLPESVRRAVLRAALQSVLPAQPAPARAHLEALDHLLALDRAAEAYLPQGLRARTEGTRLVIGGERPRRPVLPDVPVSVPGVVRLPGWRVRAETGTSDEDSCHDGWSVVLKAEISEGLTVGARRPGDRIDVGSGHRRLQDVLVDAKVPRWQRDQLPVFRTRQGVVWVAGVRAASWAIAAASRPFMRLTVEPVTDGDSDDALPASDAL